ncbi:MAG: efflux RND transporter permease subunit [Cyclobacteriaceae bacterium]
MPKFTNGDEYFNKLHLVFNALIAVTLIPFVLLFLDIEKNGSTAGILNSEIAIVVSVSLFVFFCAILYSTNRKFKRRILKVDKSAELRTKLEHHYSVSLKKYIGLTLCCIIMVLGLFLTRYFVFSIGYVFSLIVLSIGRPAMTNLTREILLSKAEKGIMQNKETIE